MKRCTRAFEFCSQHELKKECIPGICEKCEVTIDQYEHQLEDNKEVTLQRLHINIAITIAHKVL